MCIPAEYLPVVAATILFSSGGAIGQELALAPIDSFPIPAFPDPDINVNGLAYSGAKLFALNTYFNPALGVAEAKIYILDPGNGAILGSFPAPFGGGLASDGQDLFVNSFAPVEGDIIRLDGPTGAVLDTISPSGLTITGGAGGLASLEGDLFQVIATTDCAGVSVVRIDPVTGMALGCFDVDALGIDPRELDSDGTNLLYGTADGSSVGRNRDFRVFTLSPAGKVLGSTVLSMVSEDVNGMACGENQLFVADRRNNKIWIFPCPVPLPVATTFVRGDANDDGAINISDPISIVSFLFLGGESPRCKDAWDADDSGTVDIADPVYLLNFGFLGELPPPAPYPMLGIDPTTDTLDCIRL